LASSASNSNGFFKQIYESKWFDQLQRIMQVSNVIVDRLSEGSSVILAIEEGWDMTAQITSLTQLLLDPYYRTIEGFSVLIEREWLSLGHRFTRRNNHTIDDQTGFAPVFLQFLDIVHQCLVQSPTDFEFNLFYLEFLAYHYVSNRFKTFLLDNEMERVQFGLLTTSQQQQNEEQNQILNAKTDTSFRIINKLRINNKDDSVEVTSEAHRSLHTNISFDYYSSISSFTTCIWQYINKVHYNSAKFFNFGYQPSNSFEPLRINTEMYRLKLWSYYFKETLCTGPLYDLDLTTISNINNLPANKNSTDFWYPVPIKNASDYYEQLENILPTQYELLLRQIMRKYKLNEGITTTVPKTNDDQSENSSTLPTPSMPQSPSNNSLSEVTMKLLGNVLTNNVPTNNTSDDNDTDVNKSDLVIPSNVPINWKNVWDYFYQSVEDKIKKIQINPDESSELVISPVNSQYLNVSITKPYQATLPPSVSSHLNIINNNLHVANQLQQQSKLNQNEISAMNGSQTSFTPPFPMPHSQQYPYKQSHYFELAAFSSTTLCEICKNNFKPSKSNKFMNQIF
jgi:hypothetical protein